MNIAFFTDTYLPNKDGVVASISLLKEELERLGHNVYIIAPSPDSKEKECDDVFYFKSIPFKPYPEYKLAFPNLTKLNNIFKKKDIDLVHNHSIALTAWAALQMANAFNIPSVSTFHTSIADATHYITKNRLIEKGVKEFAWTYLRFLYSKFDIVTAPTSFAVNKLKTHGIDAIVMPNGIKINAFKGRRTPDKNSILHVGRVVKEKGFDIVFPYLNYSNNIHLYVAGKGPGIKYFKSKAKELNISNRVHFLGFVDDKTLKKLYKTKTALIFTSTFDTQGLVILEALASGMPVIALKGTPGEELANAVFWDKDSFLKGFENVKKINEKDCVKKVKDYDIKRIAKRWVKLFNRL